MKVYFIFLKIVLGHNSEDKSASLDQNILNCGRVLYDENALLVKKSQK